MNENIEIISLKKVIIIEWNETINKIMILEFIPLKSYNNEMKWIYW